MIYEIRYEKQSHGIVKVEATSKAEAIKNIEDNIIYGNIIPIDYEEQDSIIRLDKNVIGKKEEVK